MAETSELYAKIGGDESIANVVDDFYKRIMADERVSGFFEDIDMDRQRLHQTKFLSFAIGGPNVYTGRSMAKVHEGMNLQPGHFDAIVQHLHDALAHFGVSETEIGEVLARVAPLRDDILYK